MGVQETDTSLSIDDLARPYDVCTLMELVRRIFRNRGRAVMVLHVVHRVAQESN